MIEAAHCSNTDKMSKSQKLISPNTSINDSLVQSVQIIISMSKWDVKMTVP